MRAAQTLTVDKHAALFEHCDIFIDTDDDAWTLIVANPKARAVVDALIDTPINWNFGTPLQEWWTCAPPDWRAVDLNFRQLEQKGRLGRLPKIDNEDAAGVHRYSLRLGVAAQSAGLRVVIYDEKTGWRSINLQNEDNVIDFASARETITRHRAKSHSYLYPNGATQSLQFDPRGKLIDQKVTLPGLPGGPPLVPSLPVVSFLAAKKDGGELRVAVEKIVGQVAAERPETNVGREHLFGQELKSKLTTDTAIPPDQEAFKAPERPYHEMVELEDGTDRFFLGPKSILLGTALGEKFGLKPAPAGTVPPNFIAEPKEGEPPEVVEGLDILEPIVRNNEAERVLVETVGDGKIRFKEPPSFAPKPKPEFPSGLPLFELSPSVCRTLSRDDRAKMIADMIECDCLQLPFPDGIAVRFWLPDIRPGAPEFFVTFACDGKLTLHPPDASVVLPGGMHAFIELKGRGGLVEMYEVNRAEGDGSFIKTRPADIRDKDGGAIVPDCLDALTTLLISLATRNEVKTTERNTRIKNKHKQSKPQFIGPLGAIYISTTRVEAPPVEDMEQEREPGSHASPRPHRRRGHKHTVRYGVGRRESRVQWFPAVWVNGDPAFVADARKYVVTQ